MEQMQYLVGEAYGLRSQARTLLSKWKGVQFAAKIWRKVYVARLIW